jgi:hypothetical protein
MTPKTDDHNTTQKTNEISNMDPIKNTTQKTKEISNMDPTKNHNTENYRDK